MDRIRIGRWLNRVIEDSFWKGCEDFMKKEVWDYNRMDLYLIFNKSFKNKKIYFV